MRRKPENISFPRQVFTLTGEGDTEPGLPVLPLTGPASPHLLSGHLPGPGLAAVQLPGGRLAVGPGGPAGPGAVLGAGTWVTRQHLGIWDNSWSKGENI